MLCWGGYARARGRVDCRASDAGVDDPAGAAVAVAGIDKQLDRPFGPVGNKVHACRLRSPQHTCTNLHTPSRPSSAPPAQSNTTPCTHGLAAGPSRPHPARQQRPRQTAAAAAAAPVCWTTCVPPCLRGSAARQRRRSPPRPPPPTLGQPATPCRRLHRPQGGRWGSILLSPCQPTTCRPGLPLRRRRRRLRLRPFSSCGVTRTRP